LAERNKPLRGDGKKFQSRQPGEKRPRKTTGTDQQSKRSFPAKNKSAFGDKPSGNDRRTPFTKRDDSDKKDTRNTRFDQFRGTSGNDGDKPRFSRSRTGSDAGRDRKFGDKDFSGKPVKRFGSDSKTEGRSYGNSRVRNTDDTRRVRNSSDRESDKPVKRFGSGNKTEGRSYGNSRVRNTDDTRRVRNSSDRESDKPVKRFGSGNKTEGRSYGNSRVRNTDDTRRVRNSSDRESDKPVKRFGSGNKTEGRANGNSRVRNTDDTRRVRNSSDRDADWKGNSKPGSRSTKTKDTFSDGKDKPRFRREEKPTARPRAEKGTKDFKPANARVRKSETEQPTNFKGRGKVYRKTAETREKEESLADGAIRLNRFIAMSGSFSRREADTFITEGRVSVNNETVTELGIRVNPGDVVKLDGKRINAQKPVYILLNKPKGYVTTTEDPDGRSTVMDLINLPGADNLFPVGRLDRNTSGVLLITNDGELSQRITHPSFEIRKVYRAKLDRKPAKEHMLAWIEGVELEDGLMSFEQIGFVEKNDPHVMGLEIHSGRNRIVRRMFEHFGYEVKSLDRVLLGEFDKISLGRGRWRFLNDKELRYVERLKAQKRKKPK